MSDVWNDHSGTGCIQVTSRSTSEGGLPFPSHQLQRISAVVEGLTDMLLFGIVVKDKCADLVCLGEESSCHRNSVC